MLEVLAVVLEFLEGIYDIYDAWMSKEKFYVKIFLTVLAIIGIFIGIFMWKKILN